MIASCGGSMRGFWIAFTLLGAVVCTVLSAFMFYVVILQWQEHAALNLGGFGRALLVMLIGGAFARALFMKPSDVRKAMAPEEVKPARWIEEMRQAQKQDPEERP